MNTSDLIAILAMIIPFAVAYFYYHKPIDFNINNAMRYSISVLIILELFAVFSMILYFLLQNFFKFNEIKSLEKI